MIYRGPGFLGRLIRLLAPSPTLPSASSLSFSVLLCVAASPVELTDGRGGG
jgi:hypothetical protein